MRNAIKIIHLYCVLILIVSLSQGFKFQHFPYILTLHLKRFDFDYSTMQRIKLNDRWVWPVLSCDLMPPSIIFFHFRMTFPNILDLNGYIDREDEVKIIIMVHI